MVFRLAKKDFQRMAGINCLVILMLSFIFIAIIAVTSAVEIKLKKYRVFQPFLEQNGYYISANYLQKQKDGRSYLLRDERDIKEMMPHAKDVLCVSKLWETYINGEQITTLLYNQTLLETLKPSMESGHWFQKKDYESDVLQAVVTHNDGRIQTGDHLELVSAMADKDYVEPIEIIGVLEDNENLFLAGIGQELKEDYRDFYYTYNYEYEGESIIIILAQPQIYNGENAGKFDDINYKLRTTGGIQQQIVSPTVITFEGNECEEEFDNIKQVSFLYALLDLKDMNENSLEYVMKELHDYVPIFVCVTLFVLIAAIGTGFIMVKKQMRNYAIYYLCGLPWGACAKISLAVATMVVGSSFIMVTLSMLFMTIFHFAPQTAMHMGGMQWTSCAVMALVYLMCAWLVPMQLVRNISAKKVLTDYHL